MGATQSASPPHHCTWAATLSVRPPCCRTPAARSSSTQPMSHSVCCLSSGSRCWSGGGVISPGCSRLFPLGQLPCRQQSTQGPCCVAASSVAYPPHLRLGSVAPTLGQRRSLWTRPPLHALLARAQFHVPPTNEAPLCAVQRFRISLDTQFNSHLVSPFQAMLTCTFAHLCEFNKPLNAISNKRCLEDLIRAKSSVTMT